MILTAPLEQSIAEALPALLPPDVHFSVHAIRPTSWAERTATESVAGHRCATEAATRAGARQAPIRGDPGPKWPAGFVGSVTHAASVALAVAAPSRACASIGIDIERTMSFLRAERVRDVVAHGRERAACGVSPWRLTLLFSAKESLFKCLHPLVETWFDFHDAEIIRWDDRGRRVWIALRKELGSFSRGTEVLVRYATVHHHVVTSAVLESSSLVLGTESETSSLALG